MGMQNQRLHSTNNCDTTNQWLKESGTLENEMEGKSEAGDAYNIDQPSNVPFTLASICCSAGLVLCMFTLLGRIRRIRAFRSTEFVFKTYTSISEGSITSISDESCVHQKLASDSA